MITLVSHGTTTHDFPAQIQDQAHSRNWKRNGLMGCVESATTIKIDYHRSPLSTFTLRRREYHRVLWRTSGHNITPLLHVGEVKCSETRNRIPSIDGGESSGAATRVRAAYDVEQGFETVLVQPRVEPAERVPAFRKLVVIKQREYGRHNRRRATCTPHK